jgi:hypothetical protein
LKHKVSKCARFRNESPEFSISLEEAQGLLDAIAEREVPQVWSVANVKRVLDPSLNYREQTLLLYGETEPVPVEDLCDWMEHPRMDAFRTRVIRPLHRGRPIEYDGETETAVLSPTGTERVDEQIVPKLRKGPE